MTKKLIVRNNLVQHLNEGKRLKSLVNRGVGKTTASILACIAAAIRNPGTPCLPADPDLTTYRAGIAHLEKAWCREANTIIEQLGLRDIAAYTYTNGCEGSCPTLHIISTYAEEL